ncbi:DUF58 domain-containing protein [Paenibacillus crassostreae]|uniref:DUF58 domain-containing protein n=1 Tax=Paenibacillus crassostreae TaxID=1763538 RepID=A0A167GK17_9BACL|nr:DUF58 domain-containing protein [Paenibacillus crassostreae]AOZ92185.1 hypothetical protein LPB68_08055 [Paenibacillus crassostreae]OAB77645.1 hypothetical protein PNBC_01135 [Paenibacillus crassostreae]
MNGQYLLPSDWLPRLERLSLGAGRRVAGTMQGKRRSRHLGSSLEFADYRPYTAGDDIRRFDWGVYSRTGKPFIRQFMDEQELMVSVYVDCSKSMDFGARVAKGSTVENKGIPSKLQYAKQLAASIGYIALCSYERLQVACYSQSIDYRLPIIRGRGAVHRLFQFLEDSPVGGEGSLASSLAEPGAIPRLPGMTWIFSDFWLRQGEEEIGNVLSRLTGAGQEVVLVHILSQEEMNPALSGDLRLVDSEIETGKDVALTGKVLQAYRAEWDKYHQHLSSYAAERGISYVLIPNDMSLQQAVFGILAESGLIMT